MRIAAIDGDLSQVEQIRDAVVGIGHECHVFTTASDLLKSLGGQSFDLLVLEAQGPDMVQTIRKVLSNPIPILFATKRREEADMIEGLSAGADDFMVKPIRVGELKARVTALLRRAYPAHFEANVVFGPYRFLPNLRQLEVAGKPVTLKQREYDLALFLFQNIGQLLSRDRLREAIWGSGPDDASRSLDTHISRLRTKLVLRPANGFLLSAIYGLGYRLEVLAEDAFGAGSSSTDRKGSSSESAPAQSGDRIRMSG